MLKLLLPIFISFYFNTLFSGDFRPADVGESKQKFLISEIPFTKEKMLNDGNGVITLCFKKQPGVIFDSYDHVALVFEIVLKNSDGGSEIAVWMAHYGNAQGCCLMDKANVMLEDAQKTLPKVHRNYERDFSSLNGVEKAPEYKKFASWILPYKNLDQGLKLVQKDIHSRRFFFLNNCVKYVTKIMTIVGLNNCEFGHWATTPENLKLLVKKHIKESPNVHHYKKNEP